MEILGGVRKIILVLILSLESCNAQLPNGNEHLVQSLTIPLPNVTGRIDHLTYDYKNKKLFIAALGNNSVEILDLKQNNVLKSIIGLDEPQGIVYVSEKNSVIVSNGGNGLCNEYNATSCEKINSLQLSFDADNIRYDSINKIILIGFGNGALALIDANTFKLISEIKLKGHPESFQIDLASKRVFVNVPDEQMIEVIDLENRIVCDRWKLPDAGSNFPMGIDYVHHRLFIGCRHPSKMLVVNSITGKTITSMDIDGDADDIFFDEKRNLIYISCGSGYIDVISQNDPDQYSVLGKVPAKSGARTSLFIPDLSRLIVVAPARSERKAEVLIFNVK